MINETEKKGIRKYKYKYTALSVDIHIQQNPSEKFEDTKGVIRSRKSNRNRNYNG